VPIYQQGDSLTGCTFVPALGGPPEWNFFNSRDCSAKKGAPAGR
jgi:hypothetical protein